MQLLFKRAKIFMDGNRRFVAGPDTGAVPTPVWVRDTLTYKLGIEDGSIVNLTDSARRQEAVLAAEENREPEPVVGEDEEVPEQPQPQFGGQPRLQGQVTGSAKLMGGSGVKSVKGQKKE